MSQFSMDLPFHFLKRILLLVFLASLVIGLEWALFSIRWLVLSILIAIALSVIIAPVMTFLSQTLKIPQGVSAFLFFLIVFAVILGIGFLFYSVISQQLVPLLKRLPDLLGVARQQMLKYLSRIPGFKSQFEDLGFGDWNAWVAAAAGMSKEIVDGLKVGAAAVGGFVFIVILALYLAMNPETYISGFLSLFPQSKRAGIRAILAQAATILRRWFDSQLIAMAVVGSSVGLGLMVIGMEDWFLFGLLTAVVDLIPYLGPLFAASGAVLVALGSHPAQVPWVIAVFVVMQQIEGHLVIPLVMKGRIDLPPAHLMCLMLIFGYWFGILGLLMAPGLLAVGRELFRLLYLPRVEGTQSSV